MDINFPLILVLAVLISGLIVLIDMIFFARKRGDRPVPLIAEYARSFFPILLIVLLIRSFLMEPFRIPSSSLEPTLLPGDFILVNKFNYGLRLPVTDSKVIAINSPKIGDIVVFHFPPNPAVDYIKRVVGVPGDRLSYINKTLYRNGKVMPQRVLENQVIHDADGNTWNAIKAEEDLQGVKHNIYLRPNVLARDYYDIIVPPEHYFVMGDNRDDSKDSRYWGFVPDKNLVGRAVAVWFSWDGLSDKWKEKVRWNRLGKIAIQK